MAEKDPVRRTVGDSLRQYVLSPLSDAQSRVQQEHEEVEAEIRGFKQFKTRVTGIQTVPPPGTGPRTQSMGFLPARQKVEQLRRAYRETVMDVAHYDDVYGEVLDTHVAAELSAEVATGFHSDSTPFTDVYKTRLLAAASEAIDQRKTFCETLEAERTSLTTCQDRLTDLLDPLTGIRIPAWYTEEFEKELTEVAEIRQDRIQSRDRSSGTDGSDLCAYLYDGREWTHPVLTAVGRFRSTVEYAAEQNHSVTRAEVCE